MIIDLRKLDAPSGNVTSEQDVTVEDKSGETTAHKCAVNVAYQHTGGTYHFHGEVTSNLVTGCQRCLAPVQHTYDGEFDVVVRRSGPGAEAGDGGGQYLLVAVGEHEVDLTEAIHECVVVNMPMLIVCRDDCKGLCPLCGINRNHDSCSCEQANDSRWDALRRLGTQNAEE